MFDRYTILLKGDVRNAPRTQAYRHGPKTSSPSPPTRYTVFAMSFDTFVAEAERRLGSQSASLVEEFRRALVVNPGSAGERDHRNGFRLSCAVLDTGSGEVT